MQCPVCDSPLRTVDYEGIKIDTCDGCQGEWLDAGELRPILKAREVRFDEQQRRAIAAAAKVTGVKLDKANRKLTCPKCGRRTDAVNYGGDTGIVIDKCSECGGIWLDHGELEKIQMVVEGWEDNLPEHLAKHSPHLRRIAADVDAGDDIHVSRFGFVNSIINGVLDIVT